MAKPYLLNARSAPERVDAAGHALYQRTHGRPAETAELRHFAFMVACQTHKAGFAPLRLPDVDPVVIVAAASPPGPPPLPGRRR